MELLLDNLVFWHWFALGLVLLICEIFGAGGYLLWIGVSAVFTGLVKWALPGLAWELQAVIFAAGSLLSVVLWRAHVRRNPPQTDQPNLNRRAAGYVGRVLVLSEPIVNGRGKVRVDDSNWEVTGADLPAGVRVRVTGARDMLLEVERES